MKKIEAYCYLLLGLLSVFLLGTYSEITLHETDKIEPHQWILTSLFGIIFIVTFLIEYKEK